MYDHIGLKVKDMKAGGKDNGKPGPRPDYGPKYYAAFLIDPDGNNVEAVCVEKPKSGRIAVKVINHLGDEVMKVFKVR